LQAALVVQNVIRHVDEFLFIPVGSVLLNGLGYAYKLAWLLSKILSWVSAALASWTWSGF
jgi:hypothetical protein